LKTLGSLKDLTLQLDDCSDVITDDILNKISQSLKNSSSLQKLDLSISNAEITDTGLEILAKNIKGLQLKSLSIDFGKMEDITDLGISKASEYLKKIITLQEVNLNFTKCENISYNSLYKISDALKCLPVIRKIRLDFKSCGQDEEDEVSDNWESDNSSNYEESDNSEQIILDVDVKSSHLPRNFWSAQSDVQKELEKIPTVQKVKVSFTPYDYLEQSDNKESSSDISDDFYNEELADAFKKFD